MLKIIKRRQAGFISHLKWWEMFKLDIILGWLLWGDKAFSFHGHANCSTSFCYIFNVFVRNLFSIFVSKDDITEKALQIHAELEIVGEFKASHGWLHRYLKQSGLTSQRITGCAQKIPEAAGVMCHAFINAVHDIIKAKSKLLFPCCTTIARLNVIYDFTPANWYSVLFIPWNGRVFYHSSDNRAY